MKCRLEQFSVAVLHLLCRKSLFIYQLSFSSAFLPHSPRQHPWVFYTASHPDTKYSWWHWLQQGSCLICLHNICQTLGLHASLNPQALEILAGTAHVLSRHSFAVRECVLYFRGDWSCIFLHPRKLSTSRNVRVLDMIAPWTAKSLTILGCFGCYCCGSCNSW